jgi:hypothetical protein
MNNNLDLLKHNALRIFLSIVLAIFFLLGLVSSILSILDFINFRLEQGRTFTSLGEYIAPSMPFFTIALIAATVLAVLIQLDTIKLQKKEFEENKISNKKDNFSNHFFHLLKIYENIVNTLDYREKIGKLALMNVYTQYKNSIDNRFSINNPNRLKASNINSDLIITFKSHIENLHYLLLPYFQMTEAILQLTDSQLYMSKDERKIYCDIFRSQLSKYEVTILYYYSLIQEKSNIKSLIEKYGLLKNIVINTLISYQGNYHDHHEKSAFEI